jgi:phage shock protein C
MNRRLYRSPDDRVLAGVAGGMAETYDFDPAVTRVLWALLILLTGGLFLLLYIVMALVVPLRPSDQRLAYDDTTAWAAGPPPGTPVTDDSTTVTGFEPGGQPTPPAYAAPKPPRAQTEDNNAPVVIGAILILVGGLFLLRQFVAIDFGQLWPIAIIVIGLVLIVSALGRGNRRR